MRRRKPLEQLTFPLLLSGATLATLELGRRIFRHIQLFCPTHEPLKTWEPADYGLQRHRVDEMWIETDDGELLHAWYCRADKPIASALYCHGNTGNITNFADVMPHFVAAGISVLLFDYRGFGRSSGMPTLHGVVEDGVTAARFHEKIRPKNVPSILYGFSLGGAIAAQVIRHHSFDGLVLQSTFTNLPDLARAAFPKIPLYLFAGRIFDTLSVVRTLKVPLMILHGTEDETCPCSFAHRLYDASSAPHKRIYVVEGGKHKDLYDRDCDTLVWAIHQFAQDLPRNSHNVARPPTLTDEIIDGAFRWVRRQLRRRPEASNAVIRSRTGS
ncbi:MAG TPA: alpha/beta fold hydrolase [Thermoanaerobaculia bacterium]